MGPVTIAALVVGISLSAEILSLIAGDITEKDKQKYQELSNEVNNIRSKIPNAAAGFQKNAGDVLQSHRKQTEKLMEKLQNEYAQQEQIYKERSGLRESYRAQRSAEAEADIQDVTTQIEADAERQYHEQIMQIVNLLCQRAKERISDTEALISEIKETLNNLKQYEDEHVTEMRKNAFRLLRQELRTALSKEYSYITYLKIYQKVVYQLCCKQSEELIFSFVLPQGFPYQNAIIGLNDEQCKQLQENSGWGHLSFHGADMLQISIYVQTKGTITAGRAFLVEECKELTDPDGRKRYAYVLSADKAAYFICKRSGSYSGLPALVSGYDRVTRDVLLTCGDHMEIRLPQNNMLHATHYPPIGSEITVYPLYEAFNRDKKSMQYFVTQRYEDTEIALDFREIPIIIPPDKLSEFVMFFNSHQIDLEYDDAKLAPADEINITGEHVKIQFQDVFLMKAVLRRHRTGIYYFEFESFPDASERIHPEDIFVSFRAVITMYSQEELDQLLTDENEACVREEMGNLTMTVFREFRQQKELKAAEHGSRYFAAWEQLTAQLKEYLTAGQAMTCTVSGYPIPFEYKTHDLVLRFPIAEHDALEAYYTQQITLNESRFSPEFFVEWSGHRLSAYIHPDCGSISLTLPMTYRNEDTEMELKQLSKLNICRMEYCVPERRQLAAQYYFKVGRMANSELHLFALNSASVTPSRSEEKPITLKNANLAGDESQLCALKSALFEKNWFMIQGPPGTGKTTVIRELILQTLLAEPRARVLIVSQANVAVDNVLRGLLNAGISESCIMRCGNIEKIAEDIQLVCFEKRYSNYLARVKKQADAGNQTSSEWLHILEHSTSKSSDIGDLLMRSHQIIGATCVGLAQRNIGLESAVFDLVIVDEAGKALMPEVLIPLNKAKKIVLIGDHKQLPPVVNPVLYDPELIELDDRSYFKKEIFDTSYFERLFLACPDSNKTALTTQYRMPKMLGTMISKLFYGGLIQNGAGTEDKKPLFYDNPISLIDMSGIAEYSENEDGSPTNSYEAKYVLFLINQIRGRVPTARIAVITPYKGQKRMITNLLIKSLGNLASQKITVDTVDAFQGDEAELVIYCTTRAKRKTKFFSDERRLNVAFSRAKNELIILASVTYLKKYLIDDPIRKVLDYLTEHKCIRKPKPIHLKKLKYDDLRYVMLNDVCCNQQCERELVEQEFLQYQNQGDFTCAPVVRLEGEQYEIIRGEAVYYAANMLHLENLIVRIVNE